MIEDEHEESTSLNERYRIVQSTNEIINSSDYLHTKAYFQECVQKDTLLGLHLAVFSTQNYAFQQMLDTIKSRIFSLNVRKYQWSRVYNLLPLLGRQDIPIVCIIHDPRSNKNYTTNDNMTTKNHIGDLIKYITKNWEELPMEYLPFTPYCIQLKLISTRADPITTTTNTTEHSLSWKYPSHEILPMNELLQHMISWRSETHTLQFEIDWSWVDTFHETTIWSELIKPIISKKRTLLDIWFKHKQYIEQDNDNYEEEINGDHYKARKDNNVNELYRKTKFQDVPIKLRKHIESSPPSDESLSAPSSSLSMHDEEKEKDENKINNDIEQRNQTILQLNPLAIIDENTTTNERRKLQGKFYRHNFLEYTNNLAEQYLNNFTLVQQLDLLKLKLLSQFLASISYCTAQYAAHTTDVKIERSQGSTRHLYVKTPTGKTIVLNVDPDETIYELKELIYERESIPASQQTLHYAGRTLKEGHTIADYNIGKESTIHMVLRLDDIKAKCKSLTVYYDQTNKQTNK